MFSQGPISLLCCRSGRRVKNKESDWEYHRINQHLELHSTLDSCHSNHFIQAAWKHRNYVLYDLLPDVGLMAR